MMIQKFESSEITMEQFLELVLENGLDFSVECEDDTEYIITLNTIYKQIKVTGGSSSGSEFIYIEEVLP